MRPKFESRLPVLRVPGSVFVPNGYDQAREEPVLEATEIEPVIQSDDAEAQRLIVKKWNFGADRLAR